MNEWATLVTGIITVAFGGGGIAALVKARSDVRNGVRDSSRQDTDSLNARAIAVVETQFNYLVKPLQDKVNGLESKVETLKVEIEDAKTKYWKAVSHIRTLYTWISRHIPVDLDESTAVPAPPADLAGDI